MACCVADDYDLLDDEPRFHTAFEELTLSRSRLGLTFDKQDQVFLLTAEQEDGCAAVLAIRPRELEHVAVDFLLAARSRLGCKRPIAKL